MGREALEQRVQTLEKKIQDLEAMLEQRNAPLPGRGPQAPRRMQRFGREADELWNRFQRDPDPMGPMDPLGPDMEMQFDRKPRLGVEMAPISEDLVERYKNPVKEGVFITSVVPGSPAETAGIMPGDVVTSLNNNTIAQPQDLINAVRSAPKGRNEIKVMRKGEGVKLNVTLAEASSDEAAAGTQDPRTQNWLRRDQMQRPDGSGRQSTKTEVRASALELNDNLARDLKLSDEQKKKMSDVLSRHSQALSDEAAAAAPIRSRRGSANTQFSGDLPKLAQKHGDDAEQDLAGILNADQLKQWNDWRRTHNTVSVSHSTTFESSSLDDHTQKDKLGF